MRNHLAGIIVLLLLLFTIGCKKDSDGNIVSNPTEGQIVLSVYSQPYTKPGKMMMLDKMGNTIWEKTTPVAAMNLQKWQVNGKTRYTYLLFDSSAYQISNTGGIITCVGIVADENLQEIDRVRLLPFNGRTASDPSAIDGHDFIYLDDGHYITLSYYEKVASNIPASLSPVANCKVVAPIIQEVNRGQVIWEWDGSNYPEFYRQSVEGNAFNNGAVVHDYIHMNSIYIDPTDNNVICSMRNTNQIVKVARTDGRIMWRLGGTNSDFPMTAEMKFLRQHHATLTDDNKTLLLFDNGEATERPYTRILEFRLNESEKSISSFIPFTVPNGVFGQYTGSVQKRGTTYFIGCGSVPQIMEVDFNTNRISFLYKLDQPCYRAYKN